MDKTSRAIDSHKIFFEGAYIDARDAKISVFTHALHYSTSCFEGIRCNWNEGAGALYGFRLREHYERLRRSASFLSIDIKYSVDEMCEITAELLRRSGFKEDVYVRPLAYKSSATLVNLNLAKLDDELAIMAFPIGFYLDPSRPINCVTSSWQKPDDVALPSGTKLAGMYTGNIIAKTEALRNQFDEAIMLNSRGLVSEGTGENLFMALDGVLYTPPASDNCLVGITRDSVATIAREVFDLEVREASIPRSQLYAADEVFLCGTAAHVTPVGSLDRRPIADGKRGPITRRIQELYFDIIRGVDEKYAEWRTRI